MDDRAQPSPPALPRPLIAALALLAALPAVRVAVALWRLAVESRRFPHWDAAAHTLDGIKMAEALGRGEVGRFLRLVNESGLWPPLFPLFETPFFMALGRDFHVAAGLMPFCYAACILATFALGLALGGTRGVLIGGLAAALMAASPIFQLFGTQIMFELPGVLLLVLAMACYARYCRFGRAADARATALASLLLFMLKYNYGILWMLPLALNEIGHELPSIGAMWAGALAALGRLRRPRLFWVLIALYAAFIAALVALRATGHAGTGLASRLPGTRDLLLLLLAALVLHALLHPVRNAGAVRAWLARLSPLARSFVLIVFVPAAAWLAVPAHMKWFLRFLVNDSRGPVLVGAEKLLYYPQQFAIEHSPTPALGVVVLVLAFAAALHIPWLRREERIAPIAMLIGFASCTAHQHKGSRFFFSVAPLVWVSAAIVIASVVDAFARTRGAGAQRVIAGGTVALALIAALVFGYDATRIRLWFEDNSSLAGVGRVMDAVGEVTHASRGTVLMGTWNRLSRPLLELIETAGHPRVLERRLTRNPEWYPDLAPGPLLDSLATDPTVERVIVLELPQGAPAWDVSFDIENRWAPPVREALEHDPRFERESERAFEDTGYRMRVYRRRGAG